MVSRCLRAYRAFCVTVINRDGQVMRRGLVDTAKEKRLIGNIAHGIVLVANVDNQLEVK